MGYTLNPEYVSGAVVVVVVSDDVVGWFGCSGGRRRDALDIGDPWCQVVVDGEIGGGDA